MKYFIILPDLHCYLIHAYIILVLENLDFFYIHGNLRISNYDVSQMEYSSKDYAFFKVKIIAFTKVQFGNAC